MGILKVIKNEDLSSAMLSAPKGHRHLRLAMTTKDGDTIVLQEATVAAIVRAYTAVKTHPVRRAVKLAAMTLDGTPDGLKDGYATHQLMEADVPDEDVASEMAGLLGG